MKKHKPHAKHFERHCLFCGAAFMSKHKDSKFCSRNHAHCYSSRLRAFTRILAGIRTVER